MVERAVKCSRSLQTCPRRKQHDDYRFFAWVLQNLDLFVDLHLKRVRTFQRSSLNDSLIAVD